MGEGKAEEAAQVVREKGIEAIIFDSQLNASQTYNLAKLCQVEVKDREKLILEIFAKRASTAEAKVQVELAELNYELPRARDKVRKAKAGEQPGFFGLGKYEVDVYVRMMKRRMAILRKKAEEIRERREVYRHHRLREGFSSVAITGYTGAGKTTLFNRLTGETKEVDAGVFTTLSPTTRKIMINNEGVLVSDTVGFISRLPTYLIRGIQVDLGRSVLFVFGASAGGRQSASREVGRELHDCMETLAELEVPESRILTVMNKADLMSEEELAEKSSGLMGKDTLRISAKTGSGHRRAAAGTGVRLSVSTVDNDYHGDE